MEFLDSLENDQKEKLSHLSSVSGIDDLSRLFSILSENDWNLEVCANLILNPTHSSSSTPLIDTTNSQNPRVRNAVPPIPSFYSLLTFPFHVGYRFVMTIVSYALHIFPLRFLFTSTIRPNRPTSRSHRPTNNSPQAAANRFLLDFEQNYGIVHPEFYQGSYTQAMNLAKRELRVFLAILVSDEHDDTDKFSRETLRSAEFLDFLSNRNVLVWGGNIAEVESFQVSQVLSATSYPFLALVALQRSQMTIIERIEGISSTSTIIAKLNASIDRVEEDLLLARSQREEATTSRDIRTQQDQAYLNSLAADREKARIAAQLKLEQEQAEKEVERKLIEKETLIATKLENRKRLIETLKPEPKEDEDGITKLSIRLPNGSRIVRRFFGDDDVEELSNFIHTLDELDVEVDYMIATTFPRKVLEGKKESLKGAGLFPTGSVVVEEVDSE